MSSIDANTTLTFATCDWYSANQAKNSVNVGPHMLCLAIRKESEGELGIFPLVFLDSSKKKTT